MPPIKDLKGLRFGRYVAVSLHEKRSKNRQALWNCVCDCGAVRVVSSSNLVCGTSTSCGCFKRDKLVLSKTIHGKHTHPLYATWAGMKGRCGNENNDKYKHYGGRGISVCPEWVKCFQSFYDWAINNGWKNGYTIDRINVNYGYSPLNCRWVTMKRQNRNKRNTIYVKHDNQTKALSDWCDILGINCNTVRMRIQRGWNAEKAIITPIRKINI